MKNQVRKTSFKNRSEKGKTFKTKMGSLLMMMAFMLFSLSASAHCDSYDGPVIKDAYRALKANNVELVFKWIIPEQEEQIASLFKKTHNLKNGDQQVYSIVEKHFLETLVRLHRETEGEPYTGLKPAGSMTPLVAMADNSIAEKDVDGVLKTVNNHLEKLLRERYKKVVELSKTKDSSVKKGRAYVAAYVVYTHTLEKLERILNGHASHSEVAQHMEH